MYATSLILIHVHVCAADFFINNAFESNMQLSNISDCNKR